jgi:type II secretory pathway pseudopilin PulG
MSIGLSAGIVGSVAGSPLAQQASDAERVGQATRSQARQAQASLSAEKAAGVEASDGQEHGTNDRDADGRQEWRLPSRASSITADHVDAEADDSLHPPRAADCGKQLDLDA